MRLSEIIRPSRPAYLRLWGQSVFSALLGLCPFLYMLQISERVFTSHSWETLGFLTLLIFGLMLVWTVLDHARQSALRALGHRIEAELRRGVYDAVHRGDRPEAFRAWTDIATLRQGLAGPLVTGAMDASLAPLFLAVLFLLHPVFGLAALGYILLLGLLSAQSRRLAARVRADSRREGDRAFAFGIATALRREVVRAMNLLPGTRREWERLQAKSALTQLQGEAQISPVDAAIAFLGQMQMVLMLGLGAVLYLQGAVSANVGMAAFVVMLRGVSPVLLLVRNLPLLSEMRAAIRRLDRLLASAVPRPQTHLPPMRGALSCEDLALAGLDGKPVLAGIRFALPAGAILAVVGPSGAGKSCLLRLLAGAAQPSGGSVLIDGFPLAQWPDDQRGAATGYLPQTVDLLPGSILQNVSRFAPDHPERMAAVTAALQLAGALDIVQSRSRGMEFVLREEGAPLSGGQRQRLGLARAFFGRPALLVLDEPNAALDAAGEQVLASSLSQLAQTGSTIVFSTHKLNLLGICDYILVVMNGFMHSFSPRDDMLARLNLGGNAVLSDEVGTAAGPQSGAAGRISFGGRR